MKRLDNKVVMYEVSPEDTSYTYIECGSLIPNPPRLFERVTVGSISSRTLFTTAHLDFVADTDFGFDVRSQGKTYHIWDMDKDAERKRREDS